MAGIERIVGYEPRWAEFSIERQIAAGQGDRGKYVCRRRDRALLPGIGRNASGIDLSVDVKLNCL